jgi:DNA-binding beta-propeller fold protein YncE
MRGWPLSVCVLVVGCGNVNETPDAEIDAAPTFTVGGAVTGFAGSGLVLRLNGGGDLAITADGTFSFPAALAIDASYTVTLASSPTCPQRICTLGNATGTISSANVTAVTVTCAVPRIRMVSHNWGSPFSLRITDDVLALANNATATPHIVTGATTGVGSPTVDSVAFDGTRNLVYAPAKTATPDPAVLVFNDAATMTGDVAPARQFVVTGGSAFEGVELDEGVDRLYLSGASGKLYVYNSASTLTGTVTPTAEITLASPATIALDRKNDRLYVAAKTASLYIFDNARQLTSASSPTRTVTWANPTDFARGVAIDACRDRLYLSIRNMSTAGNVFVFNNASALNGAMDLATASQAQLVVPDNQVMSSALDSLGNFYFWKDSATVVRIVNAPQTLTGAVTLTVDKTISGVVASGYGLDVMAF